MLFLNPVFGECVLSCGWLTDKMSPQVSVIKVKIHEATGMPAGKQKLQYEVSLCFEVDLLVLFLYIWIN